MYGAAPADPVLRVGVTASDAFAEGYYAIEEGFFKKAGLDVAITPFTTGAAIATGVASGTIDVGISNVALLAKAIGRGAPFVLIAGGGLYSSKTPISALIVPKDSTVRAAADLIGKTIAVTATGDQTQIGVSAWLEKSGVDVQKVHFIEIPFDEMSASLQSGLADAAVVTEPWYSAAVRGGALRVAAYPYDAVAPQFLIGVWFTTRQWYARNGTLAKKFSQVIYATGRWANEHRDTTAQLLSTFAKVDLQTVRLMARSSYSTALTPSLIQPQLDDAYKFGAIDRPISAAQLIAK